MTRKTECTDPLTLYISTSLMNSSLNLYNKKQLETSNLWVNGNINLNFKYCIIGFPFKPQIKKLTWAFLLSKKKTTKNMRCTHQ